MNGQGKPFFGKFRGIVSDNRDPLMLGRVPRKVPDVLGDQESGWALPSLPYAGDGVGLFVLPPVNAWVWMEFEHGDPDYPVWAGCFWTEGQVPASPAFPEMKVFKTASATITIDDTAGVGGVTVETSDGMKIKLDATGITLDNGQGATIALSGPQVSINDDALEVM